jgi:hypothetical protein
VTITRAVPILLVHAVLLAGCGDGSGPDIRTVDCSAVTPTVLGVGQQTVIDAADVGCVELPAAGPAGAEHLYVALSGEGTELNDGVTAGYELTAGVPAAAATAAARASRTRAPRDPAAAFHSRIRARERELLSRRGAGVAQSRVGAAVVPPPVGDQRSFDVCATSDCEDFVAVSATAQVVGDRVAIYVDDAAPAGGYTQLDLQRVGTMFDNYLYPVDTVAFGRESDLDDNDAVIVLLTARVNQLAPDCNETGSVIAGYFFGLDLLPNLPNSNGGEIFYGLAPDPDNPTCSIDRNYAIEVLPPVFVHEFSHMIGFAQRVLVRGANAVEQTWLDEGLAHFAEELAGRQLPDTECQPLFASCEEQFLAGNFSNAYAYLDDPENAFLIEPDTSGGNLSERGANWLFVRWLADHYAATQPLGTELTRALVQTTLRGSSNVETVTGDPFDQLVARWQLANYAEDLPGFTASDGTVQYTSWAFRDVYQDNFEQGIFEKPYPLTPDSTRTGEYSRTGTLRGGSGRHLRIIQPASAGPVTLRLTQEDGGSPLGDGAAPRIAILRIR